MTVIKEFSALLGPAARAEDRQYPRELFFTIPAESIYASAEKLYRGRGMRFITASACQTGTGFEILYHFAEDARGLVITLRAILPAGDPPRAPSLCGLLRAAHWIEREMHEMVGIDFTGNPDQRHLLLSDDWPDGDFPLRRDNGRS